MTEQPKIGHIIQSDEPKECPECKQFHFLYRVHENSGFMCFGCLEKKDLISEEEFAEIIDLRIQSDLEIWVQLGGSSGSKKAKKRDLRD